MPTATMTSKGQITVPIEVRRKLDLRAGTRVDFVELPEGGYAVVPATRSIRDLKRILAPTDRIVSLEEMDEAIAAGLAEDMKNL